MENENNESLSEELKEKITEVLKNRNAFSPCPRCGKTEFIFADGLFTNILQNNLNAPRLYGRALPSAIIVCKNCGFISEHAIGVLGLLDQAKAVKNNE